ncbi:MAG: class I SAM-dependent methyltransferase [Gammaproteobacteria bacterium]|nr:class I SAM-dependent methyltransferase [Gammaproteobacteria bacterium]
MRTCCPLCNSAERKILCEIPYKDQRMVNFIGQFYQGRVPQELISPGTYRVVACAQCNFIYQDPILDENRMQALYQDWIDNAHSLHKKQSAESKLYRQYAGQVHTLTRLFDRRPEQVRVLDFGMGWGYWSRMAQAHGLDVTGYELSPQRSQYARAMGIKVVDKLPGAGAHFDYIHANQVFEHLADPLQALKDLCARLAPGGVVCIRVPDSRGVAEILVRRGWSQGLDAVHPLEHINCFTRKTLTSLATRAGLTPFNPPLRLNWDSLWGGIRREIADRLLTTHLYLKV